MTSSNDMLYCYLLDIVSHLQPLSHICQLSFKSADNMLTETAMKAENMELLQALYMCPN